MFIYLDDERDTPKGWVRAYSYEEMIALLETHQGQIEAISLDNDLGKDKVTGALLKEGKDVMKWLVERVLDDPAFILPTKITFHTANPQARKHMEGSLSDLHRIQELRSQGEL